MNQKSSIKPASDVYAISVEPDNRCSSSCAKSEVFDSNAGWRAGLSRATIARFWEKVQRADRGCWSWAGSRTKDGYGTLHCGRFEDGRQDLRYAHRVMWELTKGPIPEGLVVRHKCDNPPCCNPDHLLIGTQADNISDAQVQGKYRRERPGKWTIEPALRRRLIQEALDGPRGTAARLAREHSVSFMCLYMAVARARQRLSSQASS